MPSAGMTQRQIIRFCVFSPSPVGVSELEAVVCPQVDGQGAALAEASAASWTTYGFRRSPGGALPRHPLTAAKAAELYPAGHPDSHNMAITRRHVLGNGMCLTCEVKADVALDDSHGLGVR